MLGFVWSKKLVKQHQQKCLLRMQAILCLVEHDGLRRLNDGVGDLFIAMRGKAVATARWESGSLPAS